MRTKTPALRIVPLRDSAVVVIPNSELLQFFLMFRKKSVEFAGVIFIPSLATVRFFILK
jgi:hypothetical protein